FSEYFLFQDLGALDADRTERANEYLEDLQLSHKVKILGDQLDTVALSSGQRKRLALLRSYLEDRPIYLFDEWAADQDPRFKHLFYTKILPDLKARGKAVIVISHDEQYFHVADEMLKLRAGQVTEDSISSFLKVMRS